MSYAASILLFNLIEAVLEIILYYTFVYCGLLYLPKYYKYENDYSENSFSRNVFLQHILLLSRLEKKSDVGIS